MATLIIPQEDAATLGKYVYTVDLDGVDYQIDTYYNDREDSWYFNLLDTEGTILRAGVKIVSNFLLLRLMVTEPRPAGELLCINTIPGAEDPTIEDFGVDAVMAYEQEVTS